MLNVLTVFRKVQAKENRSAHLNDGDCEQCTDEEKGGSRLRKETIRNLFHKEFVEMDGDLPKPPL